MGCAIAWLWKHGEELLWRWKGDFKAIKTLRGGWLLGKEHQQRGGEGAWEASQQLRKCSKERWGQSVQQGLWREEKGERVKTRGRRFRFDQRKMFFSVWLVRHWHKLWMPHPWEHSASA